MQSDARHVVVAINPRAAFGRSSAVGARVVGALAERGWCVTELRESSGERLRTSVERAIHGRADALVVVGGDGMVSMAANLVAGTGLPFGIVPAGTGNDMARSLGLPVGNIDVAISSLIVAMGAPPRIVDAGLVHHAGGSTWFACVLSAGFDAVVNERANAMGWPRGASRYVLALVREIATFRPIRYRLILDGVPEDTRAMLVSVGNGVSIGGGMRVTPGALLDDGQLDVLVVSPLGRIGFLRVFPKVFAGTHTALPQVSVRRARHIRIEAVDVVAYADGERIGALPLDIEVVPGALRIFA